MTTPVITIYTDRACARCRRPGATADGLCLRCAGALAFQSIERSAMELLKTYTKPLSCRLTDDELRQYGGQLAGVLEEIDDQVSREESVKKQLKSDMATLEAKRSSLAIKVRRMEEIRDVEVDVRVTDAGVVQEIRTDTGEVLVTRPLRDDERQRLLALEQVKVAEPAGSDAGV